MMKLLYISRNLSCILLMPHICYILTSLTKTMNFLQYKKFSFSCYYQFHFWSGFIFIVTITLYSIFVTFYFSLNLAGEENQHNDIKNQLAELNLRTFQLNPLQPAVAYLYPLNTSVFRRYR